MAPDAQPALVNRAHLAAIALLAALIALVAPFDVLFEAATLGNPLLRMALIAALACGGAWLAARNGMRLELHGPGRPALIGIAAAAGVAAYVVLLDCFVFRSLLSESYAAFLHRPLGERLQYFMLRAFNENVIYRLWLFSALVWLAGRLRGVAPLPGAAVVLAMVASQMVNIGSNVVALASTPPSPLVLTYDALRYVVPGVVWAILFRRNGFAVAEIASVGCHLFLQPAFSLLI